MVNEFIEMCFCTWINVDDEDPAAAVAAAAAAATAAAAFFVFVTLITSIAFSFPNSSNRVTIELFAPSLLNLFETFIHLSTLDNIAFILFATKDFLEIVSNDEQTLSYSLSTLTSRSNLWDLTNNLALINATNACIGL
ncbi:unnamed protein product [[Candida] boidinii]|nr:unnamed protein product [[Candida] boidinii]